MVDAGFREREREERMEVGGWRCEEEEEE